MESPVSDMFVKAANALTPPATPQRPIFTKALTSEDGLVLIRENDDRNETESAGSAPSLLGKERELRAQPWEETTPKLYIGKYKLLGPPSTTHQEYGRGVWSVVYRGAEEESTAITASAIPTPPTSPQSFLKTAPSTLLAIKSPTRRDAHKVLELEARILTYLHCADGASRYIVPFHGYLPSIHTLVLSAFPLTLEAYAKNALHTARLQPSTSTMRDPAIGKKHFAQLATGLISGLNFLHSQRCIHGDIKPANILLDISDPTHLQACYCDFSSAHILSAPTQSPPTTPEAKLQQPEISAVTPDFAAPELLHSLSCKDGTRALATRSADVWALAVTLLIAAVGESPFAGARMDVMKLAWAREGRPVDFARSGDQTWRIAKGGVAARMIEKALVRDVEGRVDAQRWEEEVSGVLEEWRGEM
ncbi:hypothetical protein MMC20_002434 [Loxospora ochrophaea]|nr:hypothetical protein [Loxospora ochrophaea]